MHNSNLSIGLGWGLPAIIAIIAVLSQGLGWVEWLRYERSAIENGQIWRLLSGNFVHLGWPHLLMNLAGLALIWQIFSQLQPYWQWFLDLVLISILIGLGLYCFNPHLIWYVGLSGMLHGLFIGGLLRDQGLGRVLFWLVLLGFVAKLIWEQYAGALPGSESAAGGAVVVDAHLYGTIAGILVLLVKKGLCFIGLKHSNQESAA